MDTDKSPAFEKIELHFEKSICQQLSCPLVPIVLSISEVDYARF